MSEDSTTPEPSPDHDGADDASAIGAIGEVVDLEIERELHDSYLTYAMSTIMDRALPDVRDGLKPSQRRILVAMNDLNLSPGRKHIKNAKIYTFGALFALPTMRGLPWTAEALDGFNAGAWAIVCTNAAFGLSVSLVLRFARASRTRALFSHFCAAHSSPHTSHPL